MSPAAHWQHTPGPSRSEDADASADVVTNVGKVFWPLRVLGGIDQAMYPAYRPTRPPPLINKGVLSFYCLWGHIGDTLIARKCVEPLAIDLLVPAALTPTLGLVL